jgi:hypothetical protein
MCKAGAVSEENSVSLCKVQFVRAARTDKGVSAAGQTVSFKISIVTFMQWLLSLFVQRENKETLEAYDEPFLLLAFLSALNFISCCRQHMLVPDTDEAMIASINAQLPEEIRIYSEQIFFFPIAAAVNADHLIPLFRLSLFCLVPPYRVYPCDFRFQRQE